MAQRDKSQGFAFVYVDIKKLLAEKNHLFGSPESHAPIETDESVRPINFNKDPKPAVKETVSTERVEATVTPITKKEQAQTISQIKENLDRLQSLHHKLHAMLAELNQITDKKKR